MKCPECGSDNKEGRKFCTKCGSKLENVCPKCGFRNDPDDVFCGDCGAKLTEAPPTPPKLEDMHSQLQSLIPEELAQKYATAEPQAAGENRPITALFADISGFTPLSSTQSSETMLQLVQDCFRQLVGIVARYEGIISGFRGDGLLALFGAPILHENDAERAIRAAMDMRNAMHSRQLEVTIGINTAPMTVGEIQTQLHREYTAYGTDVILASRLQEVAEPGQILAGTGTHRLTRRAFDFGVVHDLELQGFPQLVTAYTVQQVKVHPEKLRGIEGLRARMIGREHEFAELKEAADLWLQGQGQMVCIVGEAGIGKSRLVGELRGLFTETQSISDFRFPILDSKSQIENQKSKILILEGRCVSIGQPISYWPFLDILRTYFGFAEEDTEAERAQKVRSRVEELLPNRLDDMLPFLGHLMNLGFGEEIDTRLKHYSAEQISHGTMMRLRELLVAMSEQQRLLLILEDLHWSDDLSLDLVSLLMDELMAHPLMLVCVYRPERKHRVWQLSSQAQRKCLERYTEVPLQKLRDAESRRLVQELLTIEDLPDSIREMILRKSEGNPFFIEEVIRSLIERELVYHEDDRWKANEDILELEVPDTIQSVILARVDRLEAEAKYVLQCASVIGRLFKHRLLEHLTQKQRELDRYISEFQDRDLVYEERTIPELEYAFKHALTQEATYQGILEQRRKVFHRIVAQGIERLYQERIEDFYEELAYHWERSGDDEKTMEYLMKAGEKAAGNYLNEAAIDYYTRALQLAKDIGISGDRLGEICEARAKVYSNISFYEEAIDDWLEAANLYLDGTKRAHMFGEIARAYAWFINDFEEGARYGRMAVQEVDPEDRSRDAALAYEGAATIFVQHIDIEEGYRFLQKAIEISEEMGYRDLLASHCILHAWMFIYSHYARSDPYWLSFSSSEELEQAKKVALEKAFSYLDDLKSDLPAYATNCLLLGMTTEGEASVDLLQKALESGAKCGQAWTVVNAASSLGSFYRDSGKTRKAIDAYEQGWQIGVRTRHILLRFLNWIASALMELYASRDEQSELLDMMLQMVDSTLVLHCKPKVHPTVQRRWNDTVENTYRELHSISPDVYSQLEQALESRLNEAVTDGERFFYHGQLALLAMLDGRVEDLKAYARELVRLRPNAGTFAQRISQYMLYAIELMSIAEDQRLAMLVSLLEPIDQFEDLQKAIDIVVLALPEDEALQELGWDHINQLVMRALKSTVNSSIAFFRALRYTEMFYRNSGQQDRFRQICQHLRDEHSEVIQKYALTQFYPEPGEPSGDYALLDDMDTFTDGALNTAWEWIDPEGDCAYELSSYRGLQVNVLPDHDLYVDPNYRLQDAPRLLRSITGDFAIETRISDGEGGRKSGGLLVWKDEDNYVRFDMPSSSYWEGEVRLEYALGGQWLFAGRGLLEADVLTLRLERNGDRFTGYASTDDENWYRCGWADIAMEDPIKVGIHALCGEAPTTSTRFEYFKIYRSG